MNQDLTKEEMSLREWEKMMSEEEPPSLSRDGPPKLYLPRYILREFASQLLEATGDNEQHQWFASKGLKGGDDAGIRYHAHFPRWQMNSVLYYLTQLEDSRSERVDFSGSRRTSATQDTIEYKRGYTIIAMTEGYADFRYKGKTMIYSIAPSSTGVHLNIFCNKEDEKIGRRRFDKLKEDISTLQFLRNEKILVGQYNSIQFLKYPKMTKESLILPNRIWETLDTHLFFMTKNQELIKSKGLEWRRGILIWGLPGTGKTQFGRLLCNLVDYLTIVWVTPKCIEDDTDVANVFEMARKLAPSIVFFEDLDFFALDRDEYGPSEVLGELLTQLDGLAPNDGIFVIGTTNKPGILDSAIGNRPARFDVKIKFDLPDENARQKMFELFLKSSNSVDYSRLARSSNEMTGSHIREACVRGILSTLREPDLPLEEAILEGIKDLKGEKMAPDVSDRGVIA